ncbi:Echinoderm microtubule-associated protein-like 6 [Phytophthora idaei]|nr:Echinoderm microtubule-associated protein-like 6 [Phytophthora idaei]KAG3157313.1 Echinoderm microtubule-associated protein-like 6 [Phytophthora idaei]KAG3247115.1 Echinoderm microtubule-associated protein-like 6 [Phytophthora idaei]
MGQLQGKATYLKCTTSFLNASERDVNKLWESFNDVAEGFGLSQDELVEICRSMQQTLEIHARSEMDQLSAALFAALDTDENGLVDALEFLGTMAMMSAMPIPQKLTFVYNCYDFNETGQLSLDELTLAFKSTLTGLCKLCVGLSCPTELVLEDLAQHAFQKAQKPGVDVFLSLPEFLRFADTTPEVTSWVDYFDCPLETVDEQDGDDSDAEREAIADLLASSALDDDDTARKRDASLPQDAVAPDFTVDKMIPRHPWQLAVANATPSAPPTIDPRMPAASLELEWVYGYNSDLRNIVHYVSPAEAVYPAGSVVVVYDTVAHRQRFACHHSGLVQTLAVHPSDRRVIATGEAALIPKIVIWSTQTLSESGAGGGGGVLSVLRGFHRRGVSHLAWMPSGRTLVTVGQDEFHCVAVYQWEKAATSAEGNADLADWSKPAELIFAGRGGREPVHALTVLNGPLNQAQFVTGGRRHLFFWTRERDARYPSPHALFARLPGVLGRKATVQTILSLVALQGDSGAIAGTARGQLLLFEGRNCVRVLYAHAAAVTTLFAFTGGVLSGGKDGKVRIWSRHLEPGAQFDLVALGSSSPRVRSLVASPDGGAKLLIATAGAEIFEIASSDGANLHFGPVVCGHSAFQLHGLAIHPLRRECCSAGDDRTVRVWDLSAHRQLRISALDAPARACAYSPDGSTIAVGQGAEEEDEDNPTTTDPDLLTWRRRQQPKLVNPNKQGAFAVLNESSLAVKFEAKDSKRPIRTLRFSGDGLTLAVGSSDNCIYSYHTEDWASKGKCRARDAGVVINTFDFSTTGEHIMANARNRGEMVFFESSSGVEITRVATLKDVEWLSCSCPYGWGVQGAWPARKIETCEISAVDRSSGVETPMLVAGDTLGSLRLFRYPCVKPESLCQVARGAASTISAVRFTADGSHVVASARDERCIFQWRIEREEMDVDGGNGDADDVPGTSDDEREVSHGDKRSAFDEAAAVGDFALELLAERLQDPTYNQEEQEETGGELPKATTPAVLAPSKPWVSSSVPPSEAPNEGDLELSTVPRDSLELEWVYGYRCHDVRNNLFLTRAKSLMVYPAANIVVLLDTKLWLQRHFKQHTDEVTSLTTYFGPSSKTSNASQEIAASGQMGRFPVIHVWRIDSLEVLVSLRGFHRHGIAELRFNSAGNLLASVGLDDRNSLALYDWRSGELLAHASTSSVGRILGLSFQQEAVIKGAAVTLPDDSLNPSEVPVTPVVIATVGVKSAAFWRLAAGRTLVKKDALLGRKGRQGGAPPSFLSVVYCGKDAIAGTVSGDLFRFKGTELSSIVPAHTRGVAALYSSSGATGGIASGGQDGLVKLWSADLECLAEFGEFNSAAHHAIRSVFWDTAKEMLLVGTRGSSIHLLSSLDGTQIGLKTPDSTPVTSLENHARGELHGLSVCYAKARGCTTGDDGVLRIWDLSHHLLILSSKLETSSRACAYSPDGDFIAVGLGSGGTGRRHKKDGSMLVFEDRGQSVELVYETRDTKQSVTALRFSPGGQSLVCGALDGSVYIYDVPSNYTKRAVFSKHKAPITHVDLASDSQYLRSNCKGFELFFADVTTGSHVASATALRNHIWDTCSTIYNWSNQGVWPVAPTGLDAMREITCCACSLPGPPYKDSNAILAAGNSHGAISVLKYPSFVQGAGAKTYYGHSGAVAQLGFSGAGGALCVSIGRSDRCMLQWRRLYGAGSGSETAVNGNASIAKDPEEDPDLEAEGRFLPEAFVNDGGGAQSDVTPFVSAMLPPSGVVQEPSEADGVAKHRAFELEHVFGLRTHDARQNVVYARPKRIVYPTGCVGVSYDRREHRQQFYEGHTRPILCLAVSPCGGFVASGEICVQNFAHERPRIHVWEPATCTRAVELSAFHSKAVTAVSFSSPDGKLLAAVGQDEFHSLAVYRSASGRWFDGALFASSRSTRHAVFFVCFIEDPQSAGGCRLVSGGEDHVVFWKLTPPALTARDGLFGARAQRQSVLCGASMGGLVVTGCASGHLYTWEACVVARVIPAHTGSVYAIHATTLGCATGGRDGHVKLWARTTLTSLADFDIAGCHPAPHNAVVRSLCWDVAEDRLLIGTKGAELFELSRLTGDAILVSESHYNRSVQLQGLTVHPLRPELVVTAGGDHTVRLWHLEKRCVIAKIALDGALQSVAYSPDGKWLVVGFGGSESSKNHKDGAFAVLEGQTLELLHEGRDSKLSALDLTFSPDLTLLALASADHCVYFYSTLDNFSLRFKFSKPSDRATRLDFAADSSMARVSSDAFELLFVSTMDGSQITSAASAADVTWASHKCLFAWAAQGVWDIAGKPDDHVHALAKANTQEMLVAATNQGEIRVYNTPCLSRHTEQHKLHGHSLNVANVAFTCDDSRLVSIGANDKSLFVWKVKKMKL